MEQVILITISPDELKKLIAYSVREAHSEFNNSNTKQIGEFPSHSVNLETICKMYGWKKPMVYGWVHDSLIPNSKIRKTLYFNIAEIEKWIASGRRKTMAEIEKEAKEYIAKKSFGRKNY